MDRLQTIFRKVYQLIVGGLKYDGKALFLFAISFIKETPSVTVNEYSNDVLLEKIATGTSLIRFGDGESMLMTGRDIHYQKTSPQLNRALRSIINNYSEKSPYIIGVAAYALRETDAELKQKGRLRIWRLFRVFFSLRFPQTAFYYCLVYFYRKGNFENKVAPLIKEKNVICVGNPKVLDSVLQRYLSEYFKSVAFVFAPPSNAYESKDELMAEIDNSLLKHNPETCVILLAAGPASKVIAYEYATRGIQALDVGHGMEIIGRNLDYADRI